MAEQGFIRQRRRTSAAGLVGICRDGAQLVLIYDHRLDNTRHPLPREFRVLAGGRQMRIKTAHLTSPMVQSSNCAAVTLRLAEELPEQCELSIHYLPLLRGMRSMVDKRPLAPISIMACCDENGCALESEGSGGVRLLLENGASAALSREPALDRLLRDIRRFADNGWRYEAPEGAQRTQKA